MNKLMKEQINITSLNPTINKGYAALTYRLCNISDDDQTKPGKR